jgi:hypothetical protein
LGTNSLPRKTTEYKKQLFMGAINSVEGSEFPHMNKFKWFTYNMRSWTLRKTSTPQMFPIFPSEHDIVKAYIALKPRKHHVSQTGLWFFPEIDPSSRFSILPVDILRHELEPKISRSNLYDEVVGMLRRIFARATKDTYSFMGFVEHTCVDTQSAHEDYSIVLETIYVDYNRFACPYWRRLSSYGIRGGRKGRLNSKKRQSRLRPGWMTIDQYLCVRAKSIGKRVIEQNRLDTDKYLVMYPSGHWIVKTEEKLLKTLKRHAPHVVYSNKIARYNGIN